MSLLENRLAAVVGAIILLGILVFVVAIVIFETDNGQEADAIEPTFEPTLVAETATPTVVISPTLMPTPLVPSATLMTTPQAPVNSVTTTPVAAVTTAPNCVVRSDLPTYIVQDGDTLSSIAETAGVTIEELTLYNCLVNEDQLLVGQTLYVPNISNAPNPPAAGDNAAACDTEWFFVFSEGQADLLNACPEPVMTVNAVGQNFQNGRIYVYTTPAIAPDTRGIAYVIYNDGTWQAYWDTWDVTEPIEDPALVPPTGFLQPTGGIGKIWRENLELQAKLGWAIEEPVAFVGRTQLPAAAADYFYVDHGVLGYVLRLTTTADELYTWELVGGYTPAP